MNHHTRRSGAAALAFVFSLAIAAPIVAADREHPRHPRGPIERVIKIIKGIMGVSTTGDLPTPPKP